MAQGSHPNDLPRVANGSAAYASCRAQRRWKMARLVLQAKEAVADSPRVCIAAPATAASGSRQPFRPGRWRRRWCRPTCALH